MTDKNRGNTYGIMGLVLVCCVVMAFVETVVEPVYAVKSAAKAVVFLLFPLTFAKAASIRLFDRSFALNKKSVLKLLALGASIYAIIIGGYALTTNIFDYASLVASLSADQKVTTAALFGSPSISPLATRFWRSFYSVTSRFFNYQNTRPGRRHICSVPSCLQCITSP